MPYLWHLSIVHFEESTIIDGVIIDGAPKESKTINGLSNASMVITSYFKKAFERKKIRVRIGDRSYLTETDKTGAFNLELDSRIREEVRVFQQDVDVPLVLVQKYPVSFGMPETGLSIISDIDETILSSYTRTRLKRFLTTLLIPPHKRKLITSTNELYKELSTRSPRFFYVSKSESNLFPTISNFILHRDLPKGALYLTPYLNAFRLIISSKERLFKERVISSIINRCHTGSFILIGDDTQRDLEIYTNLVNRYGKKIEGIYIRQTRRRKTKAQRLSEETLEKLNVNLHYIRLEDLLINKEEL